MKVFVTKYALSSGIEEKEVEADARFPEMVSVPDQWDEIYHKPDWHLTKEAAAAHAEELRVKKIASLQKSIGKLEKLKF